MLITAMQGRDKGELTIYSFFFFLEILNSLCSPVDGLQLDGFPSVKVHSGYDFTRKNAFRIQWMEMYFLGEGHQSASRDLNKLTAEVAKAFARTLMPHLQKLSSDNCTFLGLRVSLDSENVSSYQSVTTKKVSCTSLQSMVNSFWTRPYHIFLEKSFTPLTPYDKLHECKNKSVYL